MDFSTTAIFVLLVLAVAAVIAFFFGKTYGYNKHVEEARNFLFKAASEMKNTATSQRERIDFMKKGFKLYYTDDTNFRESLLDQVDRIDADAAALEREAQFIIKTISEAIAADEQNI